MLAAKEVCCGGHNSRIVGENLAHTLCVLHMFLMEVISSTLQKRGHLTPAVQGEGSPIQVALFLELELGFQQAKMYHPYI